jgi:hypothetical protein
MAGEDRTRALLDLPARGCERAARMASTLLAEYSDEFWGGTIVGRPRVG